MIITERVDKFGIPLVEGEKSKEKKAGLPDRLVMIDLEMNGLDPDMNDILQIGALKLKFKDNQYEIDGDEFECFIHTDDVPTRKFDKEFLTHIFKACNDSDNSYTDARQLFNAWLGDWKNQDIYACGDCINTDMAFLKSKGIIDTNTYSEDDQPIKCTFHYNQFELNSLKLIVRQIMGRKLEAKDVDAEDGEHDAVVDVRNQTKELNYYLRVLLSKS